VARVELPPLRERHGDVALLARHFCRLLGYPEDALASDILARWQDEPWSGNVRELRNAVARRLALGDLSPVADKGARRSSAPPPAVMADHADVIARVLAQGLTLPEARKEVCDEFERRYTEAMLERFGGDTARAAEASGVGRRYIQMLLARQKR
jgi:DNA-binding NtrC family response regulator